ncbi:hypothetical protein Metli_1030 [Methanofollis liminatans DSM 4140]|uniref:Uncharacterized protein n=1 Tax=Methanofollis liminatans DSM 4140 TaxID=28892 RepID=J1APY9_9EURY|nr:hypothetical protein [Methanofollis liminatans]EJG06988.1 hypothetical protein Metli_1030 [Methanofollis liminatans DSM 4140]
MPPVNPRAPARTSTGPLPLIEGLNVEITSTNQGWISIVTRDGAAIVRDGPTPAAPWIDRRAPGRIAAAVHAAVPAIVRRAIRGALDQIFAAIRSSPDGSGIVSPAVARAIGATVRVQIETCDPPTYLVDLDGGRSLLFGSRDIAARRPIVLNERWLAVHPREPLNASGNDFGAIIDYWLSIAEEIDPTGDASPWEGAAEGLQIALAALTVYPTRDGLARSGLWQEPNGPLWVAGRLVRAALRDAGRGEDDANFSKYLRERGLIVHASTPHRVGGALIRAWGFDPDIRPEDARIAECAALDDEGATP